MRRKRISEAEMTLQSVKAAKPEKTGEMPTKFSLVWNEFDDDGNIVEKDKSFESEEKFTEFKDDLLTKANFLQINKQIKPSITDEMPGAKSEEMEKVKLESKMNRFKKLVEMMVDRELKKIL